MCDEPTAADQVSSTLPDSQLPSSREEAKRLGFKHYFTGKPCPKGHIVKRLVSCWQCTECSKLNALRYGACNPEKIKVRNAQRCKLKMKLYSLDYWTRPETREKKLVWQARVDKTKKAASFKRWHAKNPGKDREYKLARRTRKADSGGSHSARDIRDILAAQDGKCAYFAKCKTRLKSGYHADHIIALSNGGSNFRSNIQLLCPTCNLRKCAKDPVVFAQEIGFLL